MRGVDADGLATVPGGNNSRWGHSSGGISMYRLRPLNMATKLRCCYHHRNRVTMRT